MCIRDRRYRGRRAQGAVRAESPAPGGRTERDRRRHGPRPRHRYDPRHRRPQPFRAGGRHAGAGGRGEGEPGGDRRGHGRRGTPGPRVAVQLCQYGDLGQQRQDQGDHAERADVRLLHDPQRVLRGFAAAQAVGGVGETVEVQTAGQGGGYGDRGDGGGQRAGAQEEEQQPESGGAGAHGQPGDGRAQHAAACGPPVPAAHPDGQHGEGAEGEAEAVERGGLEHRRRLPGGPGAAVRTQG